MYPWKVNCTTSSYKIGDRGNCQSQITLFDLLPRFPGEGELKTNKKFGREYWHDSQFEDNPRFSGLVNRPM